VKGSRSLDATSIHSSASDSSTYNNSKVTNLKQPHYAKDIHTQSHPHHHGHSHNNSLSTAATTKKVHLSPPPMHISIEKDYSTQHAKTSLSGNPIFLESKKSGNKFLRSLQHQQTGVPEPGRGKSWPYLGYMINSLKNFALTFYFNWTMILTAPISSIAFIIVYPTTVSFLVVFEIGLKLFMEKMGGAEVIRYISLKFGQGMHNIYLSCAIVFTYSFVYLFILGFGAINWGM